MIIVSQTKNAIYNFDNIMVIQIKENDNTYDVIVFDVTNDDSIIGTYKTEKRATEVLEEIINKYMEYKKIEKNGSGYYTIKECILPKCYIMPKE